MDDATPGGTPPTLAAGVRVARFELLLPVGRNASTWLARERRATSERQVALRIVLPPLAEDARFVEMMQKEVKLATRLAHTNVAQVLEAGDYGSIPFVVSEWVPGETLGDLLGAAESASRTVPAGVLLRILADVCAGLHAGHLLRDSAGALLNVVHGDLTAGSIVIGPDGISRVLGFGFAKARARHAGAANRSWEAFAERVGDEGPPPGQRIDRHADVWSVGALVSLWLGEGTTGGAPRSSRAPRAVPSSLRALVKRAQHPSPVERFATAAEMQGAVEAAMVTLGAPTSHASVASFVRELLGHRAVTRAAALEAARAHIGPVLAVNPPRGESVQPSARTVRPFSPSMSSHTPAAATVTSRHETSRSPDPDREVPVEAAPRRGRGLLLIALAALAIAAGGVFFVQRDRAPATASVQAPPAAPPKPLCPDGMVLVPGGEYTVGLDGNGEDAKPAHRVTLSRYCLDALEVTTDAYKACSDVGDCKRAPLENRGERLSPKDQKAADQMCNARDPGPRATYPINCVDWAMAARFCEARGERLPTEAEWEVAARLPDAGVRDLVGNVREWTADWFAPYAAAGATFEVDPRGPKDGIERVARGGAFDLEAGAPLRPSLRYPTDPALRSYRIGFRCAKSLPP